MLMSAPVPAAATCTHARAAEFAVLEDMFSDDSELLEIALSIF